MKNKVLLVIGILLFASGFFAAKYKYSQATDKTKTEDKDHTITKIIEHKHKDGSSDTVTVIDDKKSHKETEIHTKPIDTSKLNLSVLAANDFSQSIVKPVYGLSISKELIGPITLGLFGFTDRRMGISIGVNF